MQAQATPNKLERNITLAIPAVDVEAQVGLRLKKIARTAKMSGFRPGKVPFNIIANQYGFQVRQEVVSDAVQQCFMVEVKKQNLRVAGYPRIAPIGTGEAADRFEFTATFEVYPEFQVGSLAEQPLERLTAEVTEQDVDNTIDTLRKQRANFEPADRPAEKGDFVVIDFQGTLNGEPFNGGDAKNFSTVVGSGRMLPDFETALVGMKSGDNKVFDLTFPTGYQEELAGKTAQFSVTMNTVNAPVLPQVDAEFAKSLGVDDGNLDKMRAEIKLNLQRELKKRIQAKVKDQVMNALLTVCELDAPRALVEREIERLKEQALEDLQSKGMTTKGLQLPSDLFAERAERRVKLGLILNEVAQRNDISAKPEQVRAAVEEHAESFEDPQQMVKWYYQDRSRLAEVEGMVLEDNIVEWASASMRVTHSARGFDEIMEIKR